MVDPRTQALVTFPVTVRLDTGDFGMEQSISLVLMCQLLETKLLQLLRFRTGGVRAAGSAQSCHLVLCCAAPSVCPDGCLLHDCTSQGARSAAEADCLGQCM